MEYKMLRKIKYGCILLNLLVLGFSTNTHAQATKIEGLECISWILKFNERIKNSELFDKTQIDGMIGWAAMNTTFGEKNNIENDIKPNAAKAVANIESCSKAKLEPEKLKLLDQIFEESKKKTPVIDKIKSCTNAIAILEYAQKREQKDAKAAQYLFLLSKRLALVVGAFNSKFGIQDYVDNILISKNIEHLKRMSVQDFRKASEDCRILSLKE